MKEGKRDKTQNLKELLKKYTEEFKKRFFSYYRAFRILKEKIPYPVSLVLRFQTRDTGIPGYRDTGIPRYRDTGIPDTNKLLK